MGTKAKGLGSGGALLGFAKLYFLIASYATVLALTRLIDPSTFGSYSAVGRLIAVPNMVIIYTLMFSVSRPLAAEYERGTPSYDAVRARGFRLAGALGGVVSVTFFVGAPWFARALSEPSLTGPIRIVAPISFVYGLYAVNIGTINARRAFPRQAGLDILMATAKAGLIIMAAALGLGLTLTLGGFTAASVVAFTVSILWVRRVRPASTGAVTEGAPITELAGILIVFTLSTNLLLSMDLFILKHFAVTAALKEAVGYYSGAQYIAQVPYSLLNAVSLLMFPLIATLHAEGETERVRDYVTQTAKVMVVLLALMGTVAAAAAPGIMGLLFPPSYGVAADDLRRIVVGYSGYSMTVTVAWILNSSQRSRTALLLVALTLAVSAAGAWFGAPRTGSDGVAWAVMTAGSVGALASLVALSHHFGVRLPALWLLKVATVIATLYGVGAMWTPSSKLLILVKLVVLTLAFCAAVVGARVVSVAEVMELRRRD